MRGEEGGVGAGGQFCAPGQAVSVPPDGAAELVPALPHPGRDECQDGGEHRQSQAVLPEGEQAPGH